MSSCTIYTPDMLRPKLIIPYHIAKDWMEYGMIGYRDHNSEWGCAVRLQRDENTIRVTDYYLYNLDASGAYWESLEGERERHAEELVSAGRIDEMEYWNGLFHTHPIGSGATMSGTDRDQLEELAGKHWAVSIICPANRTGEVKADDFLYHYHDGRLSTGNDHIGGITVANMKPEIGVPEYADKTATMQAIMHKRSSYTSSAAAFSVNTHQSLEYPSEGDWVYINDVVSDEYSTSALTDDEKLEYLRLPGTIHRVQSENNSGQVLVGGFWLTPSGGLVMDGFEEYFDDIRIISRKNTIYSKALDKKYETDGIIEPTPIIMKRIGLEDTVAQ